MRRKTTFRSLTLFACAGVFGLLALSACNTTASSGSLTQDSSASGAVTSVVGGAYNSSQSAGTVSSLDKAMRRSSFSSFLDLINPSIKDAMAATLCPTWATAAGTGAGSCSGNGTNTMTLDYGTTGAGCQFANGTATWTGSQMLMVGANTVMCGQFPGKSANVSLTRTFSSGTTRTNALGVVVTVDTTGTDAASIASPIPMGGTTVTYGTPSTLAINGVNLTAVSATGTTLWNHSITTGNGGTPITVSNGAITAGSVLVYHNLMKILGTTSFSNVTFSSGCCTPTSGTVTTAFTKSGSTQPTPAGELLVGKSETLTFTACGTATYTGPGGSTLSVAVNQCF